jgi:hypothetical protein
MSPQEDEDSDPWRDAAEASAMLRALHHCIRSAALDQKPITNTSTEWGPAGSKPLNQEDLLATLLTFTVSVFEVLERYGISWTGDEQRLYLQAWDRVGAFLGIGDETVVARLRDLPDCDLPPDKQVLRPQTVADARVLLQQMRDRQWLPVEPWKPPAKAQVGPIEEIAGGLKPGRRLFEALLDELVAAMPPRWKWLPAVVTRTLAPPVVRDRLALGGGGLVQVMSETLPKRRVTIDRFTALELEDPIGGRMLRMMANQVTRQAMLRFGPIELPGFTEHWFAGARQYSTNPRLGLASGSQRERSGSH